MRIDGVDDYDNKILTELSHNARLSYSEIAERIGLSRVSVKTRMENLEKRGIIKGYKVVVDAMAMPEGRRFFIDLITEPDKFAQIVERVGKDDIIRKIYAITGESRVRLEGYASSNFKYELYMRNLKNQLDGVRNINIQEVMYVLKDADEN